jgi:hypothetical protein
MATTLFTTWAELLAHLLTLYRNHNFGQASAAIGGGHQVTWSTAAELRAAIEHARTMAGAETGDVCCRVRLRDGGRG